MQFLERRTQVFIILRLYRIHTGKHHRFGFLKARYSLVARARHVGDCIAYLDFGARLDSGNDISHIAGADLLARIHIEFEHAYLVGVILLAGVHKPHTVARAHRAVHYLKVCNYSAERVEHRVKHQTLQRCVRVTFRRRNTLHNSVQNLRHALACLGRAADDLLALAAQQVDDLIFHALGHSVVHVALVQYGYDLQVMLDSHVQVTDCLCLHALRSIHHEHSTFAGGYTAAHLVREIHMPRSVNQIQYIFRISLCSVSVSGLCSVSRRRSVFHLYSMRLDGYAAFLLQIHVVKHLILHLTHIYRMRYFQHTVCEC